MSVTGVDINEILSSSSTSNITQLSEQELGKEDFLKLLVAQMQNQDPTNPVDNKDLILQMSQFSTLEATQNLNNNMTDFIKASNLSTATSMIGKQVTYLDSSSGRITGTVQQVNSYSDGYTLTVGGTEIEMSQIATIEEPVAASTTASQ